MTILIAAILAEMVNLYAQDALTGLPAAITRITLGWKAEPLATALSSFAQKFGTLTGSLTAAIMAGQIARQFEYTRPMAWLFVIAAAFNAQHIVTRMIVLSNRGTRALEKEAVRKANRLLKDDTRA